MSKMDGDSTAIPLYKFRLAHNIFLHNIKENGNEIVNNSIGFFGIGSGHSMWNAQENPCTVPGVILCRDDNICLEQILGLCYSIGLCGPGLGDCN
ncbi:hypothetical protein SUGI_0845760 [Cryptomeria japonica]|nr:hypothetical protein SUGI_0845760 [Cryptomeria japonica]